MALQPFHYRADTSWSIGEARSWAIDALGRDLARARFEVVAATYDQVVFGRVHVSRRALLTAGLPLPLNVVGLRSAASASTVMVLLDEPHGGRTRVVTAGHADPRVVEGVFARMAADLECFDEVFRRPS